VFELIIVVVIIARFSAAPVYFIPTVYVPFVRFLQTRNKNEHKGKM